MSTTAQATEDIPEIDNSEQQSFIKFYRALPTAEEGTIRLFEREANGGVYYTFHDDAARYVADTVYKTTTVIKYWFGDSKTGVPTTRLTQKAAENFLRDVLLNRQQRIEIWKQSRSEWQLIRRASPGNLQNVEDFLFSTTQMTTTPIVMAIKYGVSGDHKTVGVSFADTTINQIGISEFMDNELYSNLESMIVQLGVKECILISSGQEGKDYEGLKIKSILSRCDVIATERKKADFNTKTIAQDLNRLLEGEMNVEALPEFELKHALAACACIINYLELLNNESAFKRFTLKHHDLSQYMRLDGPALAALNLMPTAQEGSSKTTSLYGLLNKCKTAQGSRLFAQWLKQPLLNLEEINCRQDIVQAFVENAEARQLIQDTDLNYMPDLHRLSKKFQKGNANLQDVVRIYQFVIRLPLLISNLQNNEFSTPEITSLIQETYTNPIIAFTNKLEKFNDLVVTTIDLEALDRHEYIIKAEYDENLREYRTTLDSIKDKMTTELETVASKLSVEIDKKLRLERHSLYGHCFKVIGKAEAAKVHNKSGYYELSTQKTGTFFTTSKLKDLSSSFTETSKKYEEAQKGLVKEVIDIVATFCPTLESLSSLLAHLDVLVSFAYVSALAPVPYVRPRMSPCGQGDVILKEARHPCLEVQDYVSFIPNDVEMIRETSEFKIVTGPNMGGKSTYIRQVGVIALMAQIGCFVPCTEASLCVFDSILARVGAGDSQLKGVSTFMAEMLETSTILKAASKNSLVIIDELGRGTSTYDGLGLAWAISEHIATKIRAFCMFATHYHELTTLVNTVGHVQNLHVAVHIGDDNDVTLLYKVHEGVGDRSFGIHVAELANFPKQVINLAKRKAEELDNGLGIKKIDTKTLDTTKGEAIMEQMTLELQNLQGDDAEIERKMDLIKEKYLSQVESDPYLKELLLNQDIDMDVDAQ